MMDELWDGWHGQCQACDRYGPVNDLSLCEDCAAMLERDLIRQRDWEYSAAAYGLSSESREELRRQVIEQYGEALELIASPEKTQKSRSPRRRKKGHYCRICKRHRPNEKFSGKGHRIHVCKECARLPAEERQFIEEEDEIYGYLRQSNISKKNLARLKALTASSNAEIARMAKLVLEIGRVHPRKRRRLRFLARERRDLLAELEETGLIYAIKSY